MNCSVYGKTQENLRNRVNVELIADEKILKKRVANPKLKCGIEINEELTIISYQDSNTDAESSYLCCFLCIGS